jgi:lipopolysaccharide transport system ATP-binding protein
MSETVIQVENLSKQYRLGKIGTGSFSHDLNRWWHKARGKEDPYIKIGEANDRSVKGGSDYVWSLRDVNFEIKQGDAVGIIGRNGAGKSTLLKILSRTTAPTTGKINIKGRVASLLEVGTGFHPELSGRENIFLNGAILGMTKAEIKKQFDEIVDFAGVERYIDTPVKRYSSGMYVRLAFGVAAHLEPDILIVDEVLAVGDAEFQKKALGKMNEVSKGEGRTILFVSHNISSIRTLCNKGILLKNGSISTNGEISEVINSYLDDHSLSYLGSTTYINDGLTSGVFDILKASVTAPDNNNKDVFTTEDTIIVYVKYRLTKRIKGGLINFSLENKEQVVFLCFDTDLNMDLLDVREAGIYEAKIQIPRLTLKPGIYFISFNTGIANVERYTTLEKCLVFQIILCDEDETFISYAERRPGVLAMPLNWNTKKISNANIQS